MINKNNLWFLTLFCLVIVLSIYYVTMPDDLMSSTTKDTNTSVVTTVNEEDVISALKVEDDNNVNEEMKELKTKLTNSETTSEEKNKVFEQLKSINKNNTLEETIEDKIKTEFSLDSFVKIDDDEVRVVLASNENDGTLANKIMRLVQENFDTKMYISVSFNTK